MKRILEMIRRFWRPLNTALILLYVGATWAQPVLQSTVSVSMYHSCGLTSAGGVKCWGLNDLGQLGNGSTTDSYIPVSVTGLNSGIASIGAYGANSCALSSFGGVKCWGANYYGQLGNGTTTLSMVPVDVTGLTTGVVQIAGGAGHVCALMGSGSVKCWGHNAWSGQVGAPSGFDQHTPYEVLDSSHGVKFITAGWEHTCAVLSSGGVECWGYNADGQLGIGSAGSSEWSPLAVVGIANGIKQLAAGWRHTCALTELGRLKCWGGNSYGQLGDGSASNSSVPVDVSSFTDEAGKLVSGTWSSCAIVAGSLLCWGHVWGTSNPAIPTAFPNLYSEVTDYAAANSHYCLRTTNDTVQCWGVNDYGGVGDGTTDSQWWPTVVNGFEGTQLSWQDIFFGTLTDQPLGSPAFSLTASTNLDLPVVFSSLTPATCSVSASTVSLLSVGVCTIAANQPGTNDAAPAPQLVRSFNVIGGSPQTILFGALANKVYGNAPFTLTATTSSGLAVSFSTPTPLICTLSGNTVSLLAAGTCTIAANQAGSVTYDPAPEVSQSFSVAKAPQTISFAAITGKTLANSPLTLTASASSGLTVSFASTTPAVCTVYGNAVTFISTGSCAIVASQIGNENYNAAIAVSRTFTVGKNTQAITFATISTKTLIQSPLALVGTASSGLTVSFSSTTPAICTVSGTNANLLAVGTCAITASQVGDATFNAAANVSRSFSVTKAAQTITFTTPANRSYSPTPFAITATASSGLIVILGSTTPTICSVALNAGVTEITMLAGGTCTVAANQAGDATYNAATQVSRSFTISKLSQTLTIDTIASKNVGDANFVPDVANSAGLPVVVSTTTTSVCTVANNAVTIVATGTCTVRADAGATATYNAATQKTLSFSVAGARAAQIYYVHTDQIDTPRQITAATNNVVVWKWDNEEAFGDSLPNEKPSGTGQAFKYNLRFAGQMYDKETETNYNYFRDYDPEVGRYAQSDPIGLAGGISTYAYVTSNPVDGVDPLGLVEWSGNYHARAFVEGVGAGIVKMTLSSECIDGRKFNASLTGVGPAIGIGVPKVPLPFASETYGKFKVRDANSSIQPNGLEGGFAWISAGYSVGTRDTSVGRVRVGKAFGNNPEHGSGLDIGASAILGTSTMTYGSWEACSCGR